MFLFFGYDIFNLLLAGRCRYKILDTKIENDGILFRLDSHFQNLRRGLFVGQLLARVLFQVKDVPACYRLQIQGSLIFRVEGNQLLLLVRDLFSHIFEYLLVVSLHICEVHKHLPNFRISSTFCGLAIELYTVSFNLLGYLKDFKRIESNSHY